MSTNKQIYNNERMVLGQNVPLKSPMLIFLDISEKCNFKCNYCIRAGDELDENNYICRNDLMNISMFDRICKQLLEFERPPKKISLSNHGEPLLNKCLPKMVRKLKTVFPDTIVEIHTNGFLLYGKILDELRDSRIDKVNISLQGVRRNMYKEVCKVDFEPSEFIERIKAIKANGITEVNVQIVDIALGEGEDDILYQMFGEVADHVSINSVVPIWEDVDLTEKDCYVNKYGLKIKYQFACSLLMYALVITPNGDVLPCTKPNNSLIIGNCNDSNLKDIWNGKMREEFIRRHIEEGRKNIEICNQCFITQNSIMSENDSLNLYINEIKERINK